MKFNTVVNCHIAKVIPLNKHNLSILYSGDIVSEESDSAEHDKPIESLLSESTCTFCKNDFEGITLDKLSVYPICTSCKADLNKKAFPLWVKLFFVGVMAIVVFSIFWNLRFYLAYFNIKKANIAFSEKNVTKAGYYMNKASKEVPESKDVSELASYYTAFSLLQKDKSTEALSVLDNCKDLPPDFHVNEMVL